MSNSTSTPSLRERVNGVSVNPDATLLSDEKFEAVYQVLEHFGFTEDYSGYKEMTKNYLNDRANYFGGLLELNNRYQGVRLHIRLHGDTLINPNLSRDNSWVVFTEDEIVEANRKLVSILSE